jgi:hypothetical protein
MLKTQTGTMPPLFRCRLVLRNGGTHVLEIFDSCGGNGPLLAACGTHPTDRAVSGGLLVAGAGAAIGLVAGSAGKGAIIGGVAGAAIGAMTDPCTLNLGDFYWREHAEEEYYRRCGRR